MRASVTYSLTTACGGVPRISFSNAPHSSSARALSGVSPRSSGSSAVSSSGAYRSVPYTKWVHSPASRVASTAFVSASSRAGAAKLSPAMTDTSTRTLRARAGLACTKRALSGCSELPS